MSFNDIVIQATALLDNPGEDWSPRGAAQRLIATYWVLLRSGMHVALANRAASKIDRQGFEQAARSIVEAIARDERCGLDLDTSSDVAAFTSASIVVRALDELVATDEYPFLPSTIGADNAGEDWVRVGTAIAPFGEYFTVVVRPPDWPVPPFSVDQVVFPGYAIRNCLIYPQALGDYAIEVKREPFESRFQQLGLSGCACAPGYVGAFRGSRAWPVDSNGKPLGFAGNQGINKKARLDAFVSHIREALEAGCRFIVLPELTTTGPIQSELIGRLRDEIAPDFPGIEAMVLAGTAHVPRGGKKRNRAELIWLSGDPALCQDKLAPIRTQTFSEDIDPSTTVRLLLTPMGPLGVFICRDFCDALPQGNFDLLQHLDVGLILVPSMGGESTKSAHRKRLAQGALRGWRVLLSQQRDTKKANNLLIIRCLSDLSEAKKGALKHYRNLS